MKTYDEAFAAATEGSPFSNSTEGDAWMGAYCERCKNDSPAMVNRGEGCPLILVALVGRTPAEWTPGDPCRSNYRCSEFRSRDDGDDPEPEPLPEDPDQLTIFDEYADQAIALILDAQPAVAR